MWCTGTRPASTRPGAYAEYVAAYERESVLLPDSLSWADGALVEPLAVSLNGVHLAQLGPGARVAVIGAGPIALAAVFWARRMGAGPIVVVASSRRREAYATALGATGFLVAGEGQPSEVLGGDADVVIEAAGMAGTIADSVALVRPRGTVVVLGVYGHEDTFMPGRAVMKQVRMQFSFTYSIAHFQCVVDTLAGGVHEPRSIISATIGLDELPAMFESLRGSTRHCKVMVDPWR